MDNFKLSSVLLVVSLICSLGHAQQNCSSVFNSLHGLGRQLGVPRNYMDYVDSYYGDHINWQFFEDFRFSTYQISWRKYERFCFGLIPWARHHCFTTSEGNWECANRTIKQTAVENVHYWHDRHKYKIKVRKEHNHNSTFPPKEHYNSIFRGTKSAREVTDEETGKTSAMLVLVADYVNLALNTILRTNTSEPWCLPIHYDGKPSKGRYYWDTERYCLEYSMDEYIKMAALALQDTVKSDESLNALKFAAGCIYDFELASDLTFRMALVKGLTREEVLNYVERIFKIVQTLANSPELEPGLAKVVNAILYRLKAVDWNILSTKIYAMILNARSRTLEIDIEGMFEGLHELEYDLVRGTVFYFHGQWPAMEKFVSNLVNTMRTDRFWDRLDEFYVYQLNLFKDTYEKRKDRLDNYMDLLRSAMVSFAEKMEYISNTVDDTAVSYVNLINGVQIEEVLKPVVGGPAKVVTKHFLACYTRFIDKPDLEVVEDMMGKELPSALYDLFFFNWPKEEIVPEGLDKFLQNMHTTFWTLFSSVVGPCPRG